MGLSMMTGQAEREREARKGGGETGGRGTACGSLATDSPSVEQLFRSLLGTLSTNDRGEELSIGRPRGHR